jgi:hypothetical protein
MHAQGLLVLEDDVEFSRGFMQEWGTAKASLDALEGGWEYVCVGGDQHLGDEGPDDVVGKFGSEAGGGILKVEKYVNCHGHAYLLTKTAAQLLLDRAAEGGIHCGARPLLIVLTSFFILLPNPFLSMLSPESFTCRNSKP